MAYHNANPKPGKKKKKKRGLPPKQRDAIYAKVIYRDKVCQNPFCEDGWPLDIPHHVTKKSQGGLDDETNLTLLCVSCHRKIHHTATLIVSGVYPNFEWR